MKRRRRWWWWWRTWRRGAGKWYLAIRLLEGDLKGLGGFSEAETDFILNDSRNLHKKNNIRKEKEKKGLVGCDLKLLS